MHNYLIPLQNQLEQAANPDFAEQMQRYMKNHFEFFGIKQGPRRQLFKEYMTSSTLPNWDEVTEIVQEMYTQPYREYHYCAIELLMKYKKVWDYDTLSLMKWMVINNSWWDTVDYISADLIGVFFQKFPELMHENAKAWAQDKNLWLKRTSIIFQRKYKLKTDKTLLLENIEYNVHDKEFFIAKGIGWALREYGKTNPNWVKAIAESLPLQPLSKREALKHFQ